METGKKKSVRTTNEPPPWQVIHIAALLLVAWLMEAAKDPPSDQGNYEDDQDNPHDDHHDVRMDTG